MNKLFLIFLLLTATAGAQVGGLKTSQSIDFTQVDAKLTDSPIALKGVASSGLPVTFESKTLSICKVLNSQATLLKAGVCILVARQAGSVVYLAGVKPIEFKITATVTPPPLLEALGVKIDTIASATVGTPVTITLQTTGAPIWAEFYIDNKLVGMKNAPPFSYEWTPSKTGNAFIYVQIGDAKSSPLAGDSINVNVVDSVVILPPPVVSLWTVQQAFFAKCQVCPSTLQFETIVCAGYDIGLIDPTGVVNSVNMKWVKL